MTEIQIFLELDHGDDVEGCYIVATAKAKDPLRLWRVIEHLKEFEPGDHIVAHGKIEYDIWAGKIYRTRASDAVCEVVREFRAPLRRDAHQVKLDG